MQGSVEPFTMKAASFGSSVTSEFATTKLALSITDDIFVKSDSTSATLEVLGVGMLLAADVESVDVLGRLLAVVVVVMFSLPRRILSTISSGEVAVGIVICIAS